MKNTKFLIIFSTLCILLFNFSFSAPVRGAEDISVYVNGALLQTDTPPVIENGRTLVPLRAIAESVGATVDWDDATQKVTLSSSSQQLTVYIGNTAASKNGIALTLDVPPKIINGRTMVPLRFIGENFDFKVDWYEKTSTVTLYSNISKDSALFVYILDVGQADSIFVRFPNGKTMLIDGGNPDDGEYIIDFLHKNNVKKLDFLVATHPHSDHIGGLPEIIENIGSIKYYMPAVSHNTLVFEKTLSAIKATGGKITTAKNGVVITEGVVNNTNFKAEIIAPCSTDYKELNNYSAVIMLSYGNKKFLLTGDAETVSENEITASLKADVLKVGHHGSQTSTGDAFLKKVNPKFALISVGKDNTYGLPDSSVLKKLEKANCTVYRTDTNGTLTVITDGTTLLVESEKGVARTTAEQIPIEATVYRTKTGKKYHYSHCSTIANSSTVSEISIIEAKEQGLSPCNKCNPPTNT